MLYRWYVYVCIVGPRNPQERSCSIVFTLQEGLWTARCLDIGQNSPAKLAPLFSIWKRQGYFCFCCLIRSTLSEDGEEGVCMCSACVRDVDARRVRTEEIAGPPFPP